MRPPIQNPSGLELPKRLGFILILAAIAVVFFFLMSFMLPSGNPGSIDYKTFSQYLESNQVQTFHARGLEVDGALTNGKPYSTQIANRDTAFVKDVTRHVKGTVTFDESHGSLLNLLLTFLPFLITAILVFAIFRTAHRRVPPS